MKTCVLIPWLLIDPFLTKYSWKSHFIWQDSYFAGCRHQCTLKFEHCSEVRKHIFFICNMLLCSAHKVIIYILRRTGAGAISWSDCTGGGLRQYNHIPVLKCGCTGTTIAARAVWSADCYWRRIPPPGPPLYITYYFMIHSLSLSHFDESERKRTTNSGEQYCSGGGQEGTSPR